MKAKIIVYARAVKEEHHGAKDDPTQAWIASLTDAHVETHGASPEEALSKLLTWLWKCTLNTWDAPPMKVERRPITDDFGVPTGDVETIESPRPRPQTAAQAMQLLFDQYPPLMDDIPPDVLYDELPLFTPFAVPKKLEARAQQVLALVETRIVEHVVAFVRAP